MGSENNMVAVPEHRNPEQADYLGAFAWYEGALTPLSAIAEIERLRAEVDRLASPQPGAQQGERLVETVAKAIYDATHAGLSNCYAWDDQWEDFQEAGRERYYKEARAAVAVLTPPSPALDAATIERCAEIADQHAEPTGDRSDYDDGYTRAATRIAAAIRRALPNAEKRHG